MEFNHLHQAVKKLKPDGFCDLPAMTQLVRDTAGTKNLMHWPSGLDHYVVAPFSTLDYIGNQSSNFYFHPHLCVTRKRFGKRGGEVERGEGRGKGSWMRLWNLSDKVCFVAVLQFICVSVLVFRIFPREYLLQQIHLYSLADLQQVGTQRGHFTSVFSLGKCICWLSSWHCILPSLGWFSLQALIIDWYLFWMGGGKLVKKDITGQ